MGRPNQSTKAKRDRERLRQERQQEKVEKRAQRSEIKKERNQMIEDGADPDLAGIVPGPQPIKENE
jgi:hypothetical protein